MIEFADFTPTENALVDDIIVRAQTMYHKAGGRREYLAIRMDLAAVHAHTPLRLEELARSDDFNFAHDIIGITRHLNRDTGRLENCFMPRFAA